MCGICGFVTEGDESRVDAHAIINLMCGTLVHRGPDEGGAHVSGPVALGMRRLSIIDLAGGTQPIHNEGRTVWVVLNGEIYNYRELRQQLMARGHSFYTGSDTEVLVHLYEDHGTDCVSYLRGMFAFAIWDAGTETLMLGRDRLGEKPLYYCDFGSGFAFASELKSLLCHPAMDRKLDVDALAGYFQLNYVPEPFSIFQGVRRLPAGHGLVYRDGVATVSRYWDLPHAVPSDREEADCIEELNERLREAVRLQLVSDVPLGAFLSGGIDSSTIVALMAAEMGQPVRTFSIGFEDPTHDERAYARQVARLLGTVHEEEIVGPSDVTLLEEIVRYFDEPFGDPSAIPTYHVARLARRSVKVVLTGDGGDELFAGYDRYRVMASRAWTGRIPRWVRRWGLGPLSAAWPPAWPGRRWLRNVALTPLAQYADYVSYVPLGEQHRLLADDVLAQPALGLENQVSWLAGAWPDLPRGLNDTEQLLHLDIRTYLPGDILTKVDRMTMANSLESRAPFLDHRLVEFVASLPMSLKLRHGEGKYLLKRLAERHLPPEILRRPKQGFAAPFSYWFRDDMRVYLREILTDRQTRQRGLFRQGAVEGLLLAWERGREHAGTTLWQALILELWCRRYLDQGAGRSAGETPPAMVEV